MNSAKTAEAITGMRNNTGISRYFSRRKTDKNATETFAIYLAPSPRILGSTIIYTMSAMKLAKATAADVKINIPVTSG